MYRQILSTSRVIFEVLQFIVFVFLECDLSGVSKVWRLAQLCSGSRRRFSESMYNMCPGGASRNGSLEISPFAFVPPSRGSHDRLSRTTSLSHLFVARPQEEYLSKSWKNTQELYWIGKYASDAHKIFVERKWREVQPNDHALNWWVEWMRGTQPGARVSPPRLEKLMDLF